MVQTNQERQAGSRSYTPMFCPHYSLLRFVKRAKAGCVCPRPLQSSVVQHIPVWTSCFQRLAAPQVGGKLDFRVIGTLYDNLCFILLLVTVGFFGITCDDVIYNKLLMQRSSEANPEWCGSPDILPHDLYRRATSACDVDYVGRCTFIQQSVDWAYFMKTHLFFEMIYA